VPEGKALKVLPPELPKEYREFVACTRDTLEVPPGPLTWAKIPGVPDALKPTATFEPGAKGGVKVTISAAGLSLQVDISVSKHGNLKADTSSWPTDTPFIGDQLKDLAKGVDKWVDDLNADFRKNNKKLGGLSVVNGKLTGSKVTLDAKVAMADAMGGDTALGSYRTESASVMPSLQLPGDFAEYRRKRWEALWSRRDDLFPAYSRVGIGAGIIITGVSTAFLLFGGTPPNGAGTYVLPPIGDPVTITGTLATTDLDFEVLNDISSELTMTFPDGGGLIDGSAQVVYEGRSSSGATFTNTSDLEFVGALSFPWRDVYGIAIHHSTAEAQGQSQSRELSPLFLSLTYDPATGSLTGGFQGVGFSYPATGTTTDQVSSADSGNVSRNGTFDPTALDRTDATETVLENSWRLFLNDENQVSGFGMLRVQQAFDSDAFGADCTFEAIRAAALAGIYDSDTGAMTGTAKMLAWGNKSDSCTFDTGVAAEDAAVTGNFKVDSGNLDLVINASETVAGPFNVNASFDLASLAAPGQVGGSDQTLPIAGIAVGTGLTLTSLGLGLFMKRPERGAGADS